MSKRDILVLVEGEVTDVKLMENLLLIYGIHEGHQIVFYGTDIYSLYDSMFRNKDGLASLDIPLHLRSKENNPNKKDILSKQFSRILLIFDFDPQSTHYSPDSIQKMAEYFVDSADMGMLYLSYPMIESFYHVKCIPDNNYMDYTASLAELKGKRETYKGRVSRESCITNRNTFFDNKALCNIIIRQNLEKAWTITGGNPSRDLRPPNQTDIVKAQLEKLKSDSCVDVLCTCVFYIIDYNPLLITQTGE